MTNVVTRKQIADARGVTYAAARKLTKKPDFPPPIDPDAKRLTWRRDEVDAYLKSGKAPFDYDAWKAQVREVTRAAVDLEDLYAGRSDLGTLHPTGRRLAQVYLIMLSRVDLTLSEKLQVAVCVAATAWSRLCRNAKQKDLDEADAILKQIRDAHLKHLTDTEVRTDERD